MRELKTFSRFAIIATLLLVTTVAVAQGPQIQKVEPPNWWIGLPPGPMLLLTGSGLEQAQFNTQYAGVRVLRNQVESGGKYAFIWLEVTPAAQPGSVPIEASTAAGKTTLEFPLLKRESLNGRAAGLSQDDVIYLIMPDRFNDGDKSNDMPPGAAMGTYDRSAARGYHGGDLRGIRDRLPYLKDLGITALWLTPIWANDLQVSDYHGYHPVDFYAVDPRMGSTQDYRDLVDAAHALGMKVLIDYVVNHTGPTHPWAQNPPTTTWLHGTTQSHLQPKYDFWPIVDPHATPRDARNVLEGWFADRLPDLNPDDPLLAAYLLQNAEWWMESSRADGFRLDTLPYSSRKFWSGWHKGIFTAYPHTFTIGEAWNSDPVITSYFQGGRKQWDGIDTGVTSVFDFPLQDALRDVLLRGASTVKLYKVFGSDSLYSNPNVLVTFIGNHDTRRFMGEDGATPAKLKAAFSLLATARGIPQLYAGDEIGMPGGDDPDNRHDFPGGFPSDQRNAFAPAGRTPEEQDIFAHLQRLLTLRSEHPALREGKQWDLWPAELSGNPTPGGNSDKLFVFARSSGQDTLLVVFNNSMKSEIVNVPLTDTPIQSFTNIQPLLGAPPATMRDRQFLAELPPTVVAIYELK